MQKSFTEKKPTLYIVSTPIGNLEDITYRAVNILKEVEVIFAEDTRTSGILLKHYDIDTPQKSYYEHKKFEKVHDVISYLEKGHDVALISDAGTPGISDPGLELIKHVIESNYYVVSIPGATASISALTSSGLDMQPHLFVGFLPRKEGEMKRELTKYIKLDATMIFYESPYRVQKTLLRMYEVFGNRKVVLAREITKLYETYIRTTLEDAVMMEHNLKGEYVILVEGFRQKEIQNPDIIKMVDNYKNLGLDEKEAMRRVAEDINVSRRDIYQKYKIR